MSPAGRGSRSRSSHVRSRARAWVLHVLYAWDLTGEEPLDDFARKTFRRRRVSERYRPYVERLLGILEERLDEVDRRLRSAIPNWRLERLAAIDRNVLRIGTAELMFAEDVPPKVAITEAIRLAERYGSDDSPGFVNGVLDAIYREANVAG